MVSGVFATDTRCIAVARRGVAVAYALATLACMFAFIAADTFSHYAPVGVLLLMALAFGFGNLALTHLLGPSREGPEKGMVYESGMNPITSVQRRFNVRFYIVAMTFLVFDVEIVFLYPWAVTFPSLAEGSELAPWFLGRMLFFLMTTLVAYVYAWRKGVFRYD